MTSTNHIYHTQCPKSFSHVLDPFIKTIDCHHVIDSSVEYDFYAMQHIYSATRIGKGAYNTVMHSSTAFGCALWGELNALQLRPEQCAKFRLHVASLRAGSVSRIEMPFLTLQLSMQRVSRASCETWPCRRRMK